jgi:hypothetical protein
MSRIRGFVVGFCVLIVTFGAFAQEAQADGDLDGLFTDPGGDAVVVDTGIDHREAYVSEEKLRIGGYFKALSGGLAGYHIWPDPEDLSNGLDASGGLVAEAVFMLDAQPGPVASIHGEFTTTFSPSTSSFAWGDFYISEFYLDYVMLETAFFRVGQFESAWGQGRIFDPGNLMYGSGGGFSVRASVPTFLNGVTMYTYGSGEVDTVDDLAFAARLESLVLDAYIASGVRYKYSDGYSGVFSLKKVVLGADLFFDAVGRYHDQIVTYEGLAGFFKEWKDLRFYGEYYLSGGQAGILDQKIGLVLGLNNLWSTPIDLGLKLEQSLSDWSGVYITAISWSPLKYITATIGVPVVYGEVGSYYVDSGFVEGDKDDLQVELSGYRIGLAVSLTMKVPF